MDKNIGFRRNIYRAWLDAAAAFVSAGDDAATVRAKLDPVVAEQIASKEARRLALDVLIHIWVKSKQEYPALHSGAVALYAETASDDERLWLHYGLTLLVYPFFRLGAAAIGQQTQFVDAITTAEVRTRLIAELGPLGSIKNATDRILFSLKNWGLMVPAARRFTYAPRRQALATSNRKLELWLLAVALTAHPAEELLFNDLLHLPELFPFAFAATIDDVRRSPWFVVHRQGVGWDMVSLHKTRKASATATERPASKRRSSTKGSNGAAQLQFADAPAAG